MNSFEYSAISHELRDLAIKIPLRWGAIQNDAIDSRIDMFSCGTYDSLEKALAPCRDESVKNYFRRRWYLWKCAQCDEHLFCLNKNVEHNPNPRDQSWDIRIDGYRTFDIKGTIIPRDMRNDVASVIQDPARMVRFFYDFQSRGVRNCIQNRLFIVHHSFVDQSREFYLRCAWGVKEQAYRAFSTSLDTIRMIPYHSVVAAVIFVLEKERGKTEFIIPRTVYGV